MTRRMSSAVTIGAMLVVFGAGYICGSVTQRPASAGMNDVGGAVGGTVMKQAGESGGALGSAAKLGTSISDMQEQVNGLQKNLEILKQIKSAIGG
jgi:uncharacterized protein (DUF342 family)